MAEVQRSYADALHNFASIQELLERQAAFFNDAAERCTQRAAHTTQRRDSMLFHHLSRVSRQLAETLERQRVRDSEPALAQHAQYTPDTALPGEDVLSEIHRPACSAEDAVDALQRAAGSWIRLHYELRAKATSPQAQEYHESCQTLLRDWAQRLQQANLEYSTL